MGKAKIILFVLLLVGLSGCQTITSSLCGLGPFTPDPGAVTRWTSSEKDQLVDLNNAGEAVCGWERPA